MVGVYQENDCNALWHFHSDGPIDKHIFLELLNGFVSNCEMYLTNTICLELRNTFVLNFEMHFSQISKCICLKLQNVFVLNCKMYLSLKNMKSICPKFIIAAKRYVSFLGHPVFVSNQKIYLFLNCDVYLLQIAKWIYPNC